MQYVSRSNRPPQEFHFTWNAPRPKTRHSPLTRGQARAPFRHSPAYTGAGPRSVPSFPRLHGGRPALASVIPRLHGGRPALRSVIPPLTRGQARARFRHSPAYAGAGPRKRESYVAAAIRVRFPGRHSRVSGNPESNRQGPRSHPMSPQLKPQHQNFDNRSKMRYDTM